MGRSTITSRMLTRAKMIEIVPDRFELSKMSSFVFSRLSAMPSTILSRPFYMMKKRSCWISSIGVFLWRVSLYQNEI